MDVSRLNRSENPRPSTSPSARARGGSRYPEVKSPLRREVHAPSRITKFGLSSLPSQRYGGTDTSSCTQLDSGNDSGNFVFRNYVYAKQNALSALRSFRKDQEVTSADDHPENAGVVSDNTSTEFGITGTGTVNEINEEMVKEAKSSMGVKKKDTEDLRKDSPGNHIWSSPVMTRPMADVSSFEAYRKFLESAKNRTYRLKELGFTSRLKERCLNLLRGFLPLWKQAEESSKDEPFIPLSKDEEDLVKRAFSANSRNVLVTHEDSNINITGETLRCLKPGQWLNDEVINLYLELLKEREAREPKKFLKCHFFNTFFYTKLISSGTEYNYNSVRRWTSAKRLGYHIIDCDKIFVPIHKNIHWTLAVINIRDQKLQYFDPFKGREPRVLDALARYLVDEVKDKSGEDIDVSSWKQDFVKDLPLQKNGYDCGMFMLKYIDFYSRDLDLCFSQDHMPYFRQRTAKEILQLKAD